MKVIWKIRGTMRDIKIWVVYVIQSSIKLQKWSLKEN
jgi:hypothetical protein